MGGNFSCNNNRVWVCMCKLVLEQMGLGSEESTDSTDGRDEHGFVCVYRQLRLIKLKWLC